MTAADVKAALKAVADPAKAAFAPGFFKTGPGQYGEGESKNGCARNHGLSSSCGLYRAGGAAHMRRARSGV